MATTKKSTGSGTKKNAAGTKKNATGTKKKTTAAGTKAEAGTKKKAAGTKAAAGTKKKTTAGTKKKTTAGTKKNAAAGTRKGTGAKKTTAKKQSAPLSARKQSQGSSLAKKAAKIFVKTRAGGKLTKSDAKTLAALRKYKKEHRKSLSPEQRRGIQKGRRTYTKAKRRRAALEAWLTRRKKYGKSGRADSSSFAKAGATRKKSAGAKKTTAKKTTAKKTTAKKNTAGTRKGTGAKKTAAKKTTAGTRKGTGAKKTTAGAKKSTRKK